MGSVWPTWRMHHQCLLLLQVAQSTLQAGQAGDGHRTTNMGACTSHYATTLPAAS
jgi:hypothetical protein